MSALAGEKAALRMDKKELLTKQAVIKNITIVSLVCFAIIFAVFFVAAQLSEYNYTTYFYWVLLAAAIFAVGDILLYRKIVYNILLTDRKMNRAIVLHNKVKIKYINSNNLVEYQYAKYGVRNAYELSDLYQRYLDTKTAREKYRRATLELSDAEEELSELLAGLGLYDYKIWLGQVRALAEPKEMVEVRHDYSVRRQALRKVIEENSARAEEAKKQLRQIIADYPEYSAQILQIVEKYDD
jgi:tetratricopeptide (TPR) repeat protein